MRRRDFVSLTVTGACACAAAACADDEPGGLDREVVLDLADYEDLTDEGDWIELSTSVTDYSDPIFVERLANDEFRALSSYCNHQGCAVDRTSTGYECPCHGSRFAIDGKLETGPATASLRSFDAVYDPDANTLTLS